MNIISGLSENCILQRGSDDLCNANLIGEYGGNGLLICKVKGYHPTEEINYSFLAEPIGRNNFSGSLKGLPCGGPYKISILSVDEEGKTIEQVDFSNIIVGDIWILAGQSNMQGIGELKSGLKPDPLVRSFNLKDVWENAKDPLHQLHDSIHPVHVLYSQGIPASPHVGVGPGLGFAKQMMRLAKVPQGVVPCAHGGTSMDQWNPEHKNQGSHSLYGAMLNRFKSIGGKVAGLIWYQGCSDTAFETSAVYTDAMINFVNSVRKDFRSPTLPIVVAQLSRVNGGALETAQFWNSVQEQQRLLPSKIKYLTTVSTIDLEMDDGIHLSGDSQNRLGMRLGTAMNALCDPKSKVHLPLELKSVKLKKNHKTGGADIELKIKNVKDKLSSKDRPWGFELSNNTDKLDAYRIFKVVLKDKKIILNTTIPYDDFGDGELYLYYGMGIMPFCNIVDEQDYALPMFGPITIRKD